MPALIYLVRFILFTLPFITESMAILEPFPSLPVPVIREQQRASGSQREVDYRSAWAAGLSCRQAGVGLDCRSAQAAGLGRRHARATRAHQHGRLAARGRYSSGARALLSGRLAARSACGRYSSCAVSGQ